MKNIIKINIVFGLVLLMTFSCIDDFRVGNSSLDKPQGVDMTLDTIFSRAELARHHLWSLYWYTPTPAPTFAGIAMNADWYEGLSDCIHSILSWGNLCTFWYGGEYGPTTGGNRWAYGGRNYEGIRIGWTFVENIHRVPDMTDMEKERLTREAKVIIAAKYWEMFRHFGGVPIVSKVMSSDDDINTERATIEEMYNYMIKLVDEAIYKFDDNGNKLGIMAPIDGGLPWVLPANETSEWWGRITLGAALGQKMLIQLHAASPIYNDTEPFYTEGDDTHEAVDKRYVWWGGRHQWLWEELKATCELFVELNAANGNVYRLIQPTVRNEAGYMLAFRNAYFNRGDFHTPTAQKGFFEIVYTHLDKPQLGWWDHLFNVSSYSNDWGQQNPTSEFMEMFGWADGRVFDPTGVYLYDQKPSIPPNVTVNYEVPDEVLNRPPRDDNYYIFDNRDPRLYETLWVQKRGMAYRTHSQVEIWPGGNIINAYPDGLAHGIGHTKWVLTYDGGSMARDRQYCWPILRMGAFHLIYAEALAMTGDVQGALDQMHHVRNRVGLGRLEVANPHLNFNDQSVLIEYILRERAVELGYEDTRFMDMVRWKRKDLFTRQLHGWWTYRVDGKQGPLATGESYPELWYVKEPITFRKPRRWWEPGGWSDKWYLSPFPQSEILKGYGLVQNPGW